MPTSEHSVTPYKIASVTMRQPNHQITPVSVKLNYYDIFAIKYAYERSVSKTERIHSEHDVIENTIILPMIYN